MSYRRSLTRHADFAKMLLPSTRGIPRTAKITRDVVAEANANGSDGTIIRNVMDYGDSFGEDPRFLDALPNDYIAFEPTQIKSATDNTGAFDQQNPDIRFSVRRDPPPKKTGIGYKVFFMRDGKLYPPMVANPNGADTPVGVWLDADAAPVVETSKTGRSKVKAGGKGTQGGSGTLAYRPGWHLGKIPYALQFNRGEKVDNELGIRNQQGDLIKVGRYFPKDFVWAEVEYSADHDYQDEAMKYGINPSGRFQHSLAGLPYLPKDGSYEYRTNANPATDPWIITGAMKVNRILTKDEVDALVRKAGRTPQEVEPDARHSVTISQDLREKLTFQSTTERDAKARIKTWRDERRVFKNARNGRSAQLKADWTKIFSEPAKKKSASFEAHYAAANRIDTLFENSVWMWDEPPRNGSADIRAYAKYGCPFEFGGETYLAKLTIKEYADPKAIDGFYSVEAIDVQKISAGGINAGITSIEGHELDPDATAAMNNMLTTTENSIAYPAAEVNPVMTENETPEQREQVRPSVFVGAKASQKIEQTKSLIHAEAMLRRDFGGEYSPEARDTIYVKTGWWRGTDGLWRFEIRDIRPRKLESSGDCPPRFHFHRSPMQLH